MGPPRTSPVTGSLARKCVLSEHSTYLVAIPKNPRIHIHRTAPGPPTAMAIATPPMLPIPTVPESAAERA